MNIAYLHLNTTVGGREHPYGGYTIAIAQHPSGAFNYRVTICQCHDKQRFDPAIGERTAEAKMKGGKFFVLTAAQLDGMIDVLNSKVTR